MARKNRVRRAKDKARSAIVGVSWKNIAVGAGARLAVNQLFPKIVPFGMQNPVEQAVVGLVPGQKHFMKVAFADAIAIVAKQYVMPRVLGMTRFGGQTNGTIASTYGQSVQGAVVQG
tara:strand:- start:881 stop:1231 length:351 start_codon:yes stop_codon:yes gene_type:complete